MTEVTFATGNSNKFYEASKICERFGLTLLQQEIDIHEIQHHEAVEITKAKVASAWEALKVPVVVNDSSWHIPALGGFPGGYMKDVTSWLSTEDFMALMKNKDDKRIFLYETVAYQDSDTTVLFTHKRIGQFFDEPKGTSLPTFARLVEMEGDGMRIAEVFDKGNWNTDSVNMYKHWYDFAKWYAAKTKGES